MEQNSSTQFFGKIRVQFRRYLGVMQRVWWLLPLTVSVGLLIAAIFVLHAPPAFESTAQMAMPGQLTLQPGETTYNEDMSENFNGTQKALMLGDQVQSNAAKRVAALHPELPPMEADFNVMIKPNTEIFVLSATSPSPVYSQAFLDAAMDEYQNLKKEQLYKQSDTTADAITQQMKKLEKDMADNDADMLQFQKNNDVSFLEKEGNDAGAYLLQLGQQLDAAPNRVQSPWPPGHRSGARPGQQAAVSPDADGKRHQRAAPSQMDGDSSLVLRTARSPITRRRARTSRPSRRSWPTCRTRLKPRHPKIISALNDQIKLHPKA